ncbi:T9SS type B sorting domain-containing protein [Gilvibacter sp.]|uniref:T9SS type B sorting domain-containing protein n=1 Tax=Gilvibacter sp. TaxID=2729997 RepID=UPI003F49F190
MKKLLFFFLLLFGCALNLQAQGEAANWYFGSRAGLNFNTSPPTPLTDGALETLEGCATISDSAGNLLFYTNGTLVWNRDHQVMPNGTGLLGEDTSTQSAIIVPNPQEPNLYYIFTVDGLFPGENDPSALRGLNYSTVNMDLDGGLGDIVTTEKNINLLPTNSEKITAVRNADCESIWVITHFVDRFYAYDVGSAGVNPVPVESLVEPEVPLIGYRDNALGYLKSSPDGSKLAIAHATLNENPASDAGSPGALFVYDFDTATGVASGGLDLDVNGNSPYGLEFSPDSNLVYTCAGVYDSDGFDFGEVYQFDLTAPDPSATRTVLSTNDNSTGALQLGIDGRIYRVILNQASLDVINEPNTPGTGANYQRAAVSLGGRTGNFGLPPFIQSLFLNTVDIIQNGESATTLNLCEGDSFTLVAPEIPGATYVWTLDDVVLPESDFDLEVSTSGLYRVEIDPMNGECPIIGRANVIINPLPEAFDSLLTQCDADGNDDGFSVFNLTEAIPELTGSADGLDVSFHQTLLQAQNNVAPLPETAYTNLSNPQTIFARVFDQAGCSSIAELELIVAGEQIDDIFLSQCDDATEDGITAFDLSLAEATILDGLPPDLSLSFYGNLEDVLAETNPITSPYTNTDPFTQTIYARLEQDNDCFGIARIFLEVYGLPNIVTEDEQLYCLNSFPETITLDVGPIIDNDSPIEAYSYLWSTGEITPTIAVNEAGVYFVDIINPEGCSKRRTITVVGSRPATIDSIEVTDLSETNTLVINASGPGDYEYALNDPAGRYQASNTFTDVPPGIYTVYVRDRLGCGISEQIVSVLGFPNYFTPNGDGVNDFWQVLGVRRDFEAGAQIYIYDRYGKMLTRLNPLGQGWDGIYNGNPMPSSDYWFRVIFEDGRELRSHFSLVR